MASNGKNEESSDGEKRRGGTAVFSAKRIFDFVYVERGAVGGIISAFIMLAYLLIINAQADILSPFKEASSVWLGPQALSEKPSIILVLVLGIATGLFASVAWGALFGLSLAIYRSSLSRGMIVTLGALFGIFVWLADFYILAPLFWPWLSEISSLWYLVGHMCFFGLPLGLYVAFKTGN